MKNEYQPLKIELIIFENMDIITDSYDDDPGHGNGGNEHGI